VRKLVLLTLVLLALVLADRVEHPSATPRLTPSPATESVDQVPAGFSTRNFAGYNLATSTRMVSGAWSVPAISPTSPDGSAATWVDVADYSPNSSFIQAGVIESQRSGVASYVAFWSDEASNYRAYRLAKTVGPGDRLAVTISLLHSVWTISVTNETRRWRHITRIHSDSNESSQYAGWLQEDPMNGRSTIPYPKMGLVAFGDLRINSSSVKSLSSSALVMHLPGGAVMTPSKELNDGFTLRLARP
jgi:Peptidase A4 family